MKKLLTFILVLAMVMSVSSFAMAEEKTVSSQAELNTAIANAVDLESIARENKVSFTSVVVQCLEYALEHMDAGDSMERVPVK
ncbi:MAG: hypothetical protein IJN08_02790 [Clostridia bacterium]|nr:hypothetical protein [Clostridia bacterium]